MEKMVRLPWPKLTVPDGARHVQIFDDALPGFGIGAFAGGKRFYFVSTASGAS